MLWAKQIFRHIALFGGLILVLSGCMAVSVENLGDRQMSSLSDIAFAPAKKRSEQLLIRGFRDVAGQQADDPAWQLSYALAYSESSALSVRGTTSTLTNSKMTLAYKLVNLETGLIETSGTITAEATSGAVSSYYGQSTSARHAEERLAQLLGTRLAQRLTSYFGQRRADRTEPAIKDRK